MRMGGYDDMPVRELMVQVIERWYPDDDAPYDRVDELLDPCKAAGFEFGITTEQVEEWAEAITQLRERAGDPAVSSGAASGEHPRPSAPTSDDRRGGDRKPAGLGLADDTVGREPRTPEEWVEWGRWDEDDDREVDKRKAWQVGMMRRDDGTYDVYLLLSDPQIKLERLEAIKLAAALKVAAGYSVSVEIDDALVPAMNDDGEWVVNGEPIPTRPFSELSDQVRERLTAERAEIVARILELETQSPEDGRTAEWREKNVRLSEIDKLLYRRRGARDA